MGCTDNPPRGIAEEHRQAVRGSDGANNLRHRRDAGVCRDGFAYNAGACSVDHLGAVNLLQPKRC
ncbi:MAG: hypothetical protein NVSMB6_02610 [Burkholderiaceae bacterium]